VNGSSPVQSPVLSLNSVTVRYPNSDRVALGDFSMSVGPGEVVGLLGPSGAGKTTLLNVIAGLVDPTGGSLTVLGSEPSQLDPRALRRLRSRVAMAHQQLALVPSLRVIHNVNGGKLGSWSRRKSIASLLRPAELDDARTVLATLGIADKINQRTSSLSGGQQQRVALARVLCQNADLLLADEPVSSVDPGWANEVLALLSGQVHRTQSTLIVSLHDPALAKRWCTRVVGIRNGSTIFDTPTDGLTEQTLVELYDVRGNETELVS
jgi:phosphonate transport system ATP-binding protein